MVILDKVCPLVANYNQRNYYYPGAWEWMRFLQATIGLDESNCTVVMIFDESDFHPMDPILKGSVNDQEYRDRIMEFANRGMPDDIDIVK